MMSRRSELSLGGTHGPTQDACTQARLEGVPGDQVDRTSQPFLEMTTQPCEPKEGHGLVELDQEIDVELQALGLNQDATWAPSRESGRHSVPPAAPRSPRRRLTV